MKQEEAQEKLKELDKQLEETKKQKKELETMFTFSGIYTKVAGRNNILRELRDDKKLTDSQKYEQGIEVLKEYVKTL